MKKDAFTQDLLHAKDRRSHHHDQITIDCHRIDFLFVEEGWNLGGEEDLVSSQDGLLFKIGQFCLGRWLILAQIIHAKISHQDQAEACEA